MAVMLTLKVGDMYAVSGTGDAVAGTIGVYFSGAGTIGITTTSGRAVNLTGAVGTFIECPIASWTSLGSAVVVGVIGR